MFNLQGGELVIILLLALVVLGPEKLPDAMRKLGQFYGEIRKMSNSFQKEFKAAVDEPMREVRDTANMLRDSADFRKLADGQRAEKPKSAEMAPVAPADPTQTPTTDVPPSIATTGAPAAEPQAAAPPSVAGNGVPAAQPEAALETPVERAAAAAGEQADAAAPPAFAAPTMEDFHKVRGGRPSAGAAVPAPAPPPPPPPASAPTAPAEEPTT